ncbi:Late embryogenesis abundant protein LEA_2 subgroup [Arabidopsis suecica]|uniref:Late embryogenesis abundant protein LEA_2 subgroup n=1 Tax=Arabidopsis suecica TaxID=45249 RepID=A0A8T2B1W6_ARASU|nr:Late embryogenesis abundant protein LEA_2 subgroup [Arabidopsis suecica]
MGTKQPYLNGAYYGPSIPPPAKAHRSYDSPGFGCCCFSCLGSCLRCCGCCILSMICNILIAIAVILAITGFILWLIFRPNAVKFYVAEANLNRFSFDSNNNSNLHYSLDLNFTIRNPNQRVGVYYDEISVSGYYGDQRFGSVNVSSFYQGHKNTTVVLTKIEGQNLVVLGDGARTDLKEDEKSGIYRIDAKLRLSVRFKFWVIKSWKLKPKIKCDDLKIPLGSSNSTGGFKFQPVKCDFDLS